MKKVINAIIFIFFINSYSYTSNDLFQKAEKSKKNGNISEARKLYFLFFTKNPHSIFAPEAMYRYALLDIPFNESIIYLKRIIKEYSNYSGVINVYERLGILNFLKEDYKECIRVFNKTINSLKATQNQKQKAYYYIAKSYFLIGNNIKAKYFFNILINSGNRYFIPLAKLEIGEIYFKEKNLNQAQNIYEDIVREYQESEAELKAIYRLGIIYSINRDIKKSQAAFKYIIKAYPLSLEASFAREKLIKLNKGIFSEIDDINHIQKLIRENEIREIEEHERIDKNQKKQKNTQNRILTRIGKQDKLTIHIGNFSNKSYAYNLLKILKKNNYKAYIIEKVINNKNFFILNVGEYNELTKAENDAYNIVTKFKIRANIIVRKYY